MEPQAQVDKSLRPSLPQVPVSPKKLEVIVLREENESFISQILEMEDRLSDKMRYTRKDILDSIRNQEELLICYIEKDRILGYLVAVPHNNVVKELKDEDPDLYFDENRFYIDRICAKKVHNIKIAKLLTDKLIREANRRGMKKYSSHIRVNNGINKLIRKMFNKVLTGTRKNVFLSKHGDESFEYMEFTLP